MNYEDSKVSKKLSTLGIIWRKNSTWRLFDDKDLSIGDEIELQEFGTGVFFAKARIVKLVEKSFKDLTDEDKVGHESYKSNDEMYATYSEYYKTTIGPETKLKIIWFTILR